MKSLKSETPNLHVSKNLTTSKTKQDGEKRKTPLRLSGGNFGRVGGGGGGDHPVISANCREFFVFVGISKTIEYTES